MTIDYMKKMIIAGLMMVAAIAQAQVVKEQEQAVVYYMPKTELVFRFAYEQTIHTAGVYAAYAKEMLGIDEPVMQSDTTYRLIDVTTATKASADDTRVFKVLANSTLNTQYIALTKDGRLRGYNEELKDEKRMDERRKAKDEGQVLRPAVIPFMEADMRTTSKKERAQKIASQIFQIRETRMFILAGEVDHAPADGIAMERVLNELNQQEQNLVALFAGKTEVTRMEKEIVFYPTQSEEVVLANFSTESGFGTGESIMLTLAATRQFKAAPTGTPDKKAPQPSQLYYNLPGSVHYSLVYRDKLLAENTAQVAQLGVEVPLSNELFKKEVHILFNTFTGNIQTIYQ